MSSQAGDFSQWIRAHGNDNGRRLSTAEWAERTGELVSSGNKARANEFRQAVVTTKVIRFEDGSEIEVETVTTISLRFKSVRGGLTSPRLQSVKGKVVKRAG